LMVIRIGISSLPFIPSLNIPKHKFPVYVYSPD
jgi:hypothetical protein